jgi:hypothetical protein
MDSLIFNSSHCPAAAIVKDATGRTQPALLPLLDATMQDLAKRNNSPAASNVTISPRSILNFVVVAATASAAQRPANSLPTWIVIVAQLWTSETNQMSYLMRHGAAQQAFIVITHDNVTVESQSLISQKSVNQPNRCLPSHPTTKVKVNFRLQ